MRAGEDRGQSVVETRADGELVADGVGVEGTGEGGAGLVEPVAGGGVGRGEGEAG